MFILQTRDVQFCLVIKEAKQPQQLQGLLYRGFLFSKVGSYHHKQYDFVIKKCRESLEGNLPITTIVVKDYDGLSLWSHDPKLKIANSDTRAKSELARHSILFKVNFFNYRPNLEIERKWNERAIKFWEEISESNLIAEIKFKNS
ncbi:MAG: hypothetical protein ACFBSE_16440 [Prochloraceae cyanobacterium]